MSKYTSAQGVQIMSNGWRLLRNKKTTWKMLGEVLRGQYRMSMLTTLVCIGALLYAIFPFDFIPDYIPFVGWIDDGALLFLAVKMLLRETQRFNRHKAMERRGK